MTVVVRLDLFNQGEDVLGMEDSRAMTDGDSPSIQSAGSHFRHQAVLVVVDRDAVRNRLEGVVQLDQLDCGRVAHRHVQKHRQHLLLEEAGIEPKRQEHRGQQPSAPDLLFEVFRENCVGDVGHDAL